MGCGVGRRPPASPFCFSQASQVWAKLRNFHDFSWAPNVISKVEVVGDKAANEIGAQRKLNDAFEEILIDLNDADRSVRYTIDNGPAPLDAHSVQSYVGFAKVLPITATNQSFVLWTSDYTTKDDEAVGAFCNPIYQALLNDLAGHFR